MASVACEGWGYFYNHEQCIFNLKDLTKQVYLSGETFEQLGQVFVAGFFVLAIVQYWSTVIWPWLQETGSDAMTFFTQNITKYKLGVVVFIVTIVIWWDESRPKNSIHKLISCMNIPMIIVLWCDAQGYASKWYYNRKVLANQLKVTAKRNPTPEPKSLEWYDPLFLIATLCYGTITCLTCLTTWYINYIFDLAGPLPIVWLWRYKRNRIRDNYPRCLVAYQEPTHKRYNEYNFWLKSGYKLWWWAFSSRFISRFTLHTYDHYLYWKSGYTSVPSEYTILFQFSAGSLISTTICDVIWCVALYVIHVAYMTESTWVRDWVQWECPIIWTDNYGLSGSYWPPANDASDITKRNMQFDREQWWNLNHDKSKTTNDWLFYMIYVRILLTVGLKYEWIIWSIGQLWSIFRILLTVGLKYEWIIWSIGQLWSIFHFSE